MRAVGIIAEFNPLHTGHKYLIDSAKRLGAAVCVISSSFVQRGDTAVASKYDRARAALLCGADLVLELPVGWSMSTAQNFALGGISVLDAIGCDTVMFGSECGSIDTLAHAAAILSTEQFSQQLTDELKSGITFAAARESAAKKCGLSSDILKYPNNNLGIEYMLAARNIGSKIDFMTVERQGAAHDSVMPDGGFVSASLLRERMKCGDTEFVKQYIPAAALPCFENLSDIKRIENAILAVLRMKTPEQLSLLPDLSEGLENKLYTAIRLATTLDELYNMIKVKRYTLARVRRLVLSAFLGIDNTFFMQKPPYIRILGFSRAGEELLKTAVPHSLIPVAVRVSDIAAMGNEAKLIFDTECRAADMFSLSLFKPLPCGEEYKLKIIKTEC